MSAVLDIICEPALVLMGSAEDLFHLRAVMEKVRAEPNGREVLLDPTVASFSEALRRNDPGSVFVLFSSQASDIAALKQVFQEAGDLGQVWVSLEHNAPIEVVSEVIRNAMDARQEVDGSGALPLVDLTLAPPAANCNSVVARTASMAELFPQRARRQRRLRWLAVGITAIVAGTVVALALGFLAG